MFNPLGGFHFKPTEEELKIRQKMEEDRKKQAGVSEKKETTNSKSSTTTSSKNGSEEKTTETNKVNNARPATNETDPKNEADTTTNNSKEKSKTESSSYYFFKSTDPEKAKEFKPKPIDEETAKKKEQQAASKTVASLWNTGSTMEEYDYSEWVHQRLKQELPKVQFTGGPIRIDEVENVGGTATFLFARGKLRAGWDLNLKAKWKGVMDGKEVEGSISMEDIVDSDDCDDWGFEVSAKESQSEFDKGRRVVINEKKKILDVINRVLAEFKSKKSSK